MFESINFQYQRALFEKLLNPNIVDSPEAFVELAFPWGEPGSALSRFSGPRQWQRDELKQIADHLQEQKCRIASGLSPEMYRSATASGRGPGKTALLSWLALWFMSTRVGGTVIISANSEDQLRNKVFSELSLWYSLLLNKKWFELDALALKPAPWFSQVLQDQLKIDCKYYYCKGQLWAEESPEAFAGVHNQRGVMVLMDEASGIPNSIFSITEGFFTEPNPDRFWHIFSNPRRNSGSFYDCFHGNSRFWRCRQIDSRLVEGADQEHLASMIARFGGEDSDEARYEVRGLFPNAGSRQFIPVQSVRDAQERAVVPDPSAPLMMGIDVARFGVNQTVFRWRHGRDARSIPPVKVRGKNAVEIANLAAWWIDKTQPDAVVIDAAMGAAVADILRDRGYRHIYEIEFGSAPDKPEFSDKRTEMFAMVRDWLPGGCLDSDPELYAGLVAPEYGFGGPGREKIKLESKDAMARRGLKSNDDADALALTFGVRVARKDRPRGGGCPGRIADGVGYNPFQPWPRG